MKIKTSVFATSNNTEKIIPPLQSRFFVVKMEPYNYEQFYEITVNLLTKQYNIDTHIVETTADSVWSTCRSIRDFVRIGKMAKSTEDVYWLVNSFFNNNHNQTKE